MQEINHLLKHNRLETLENLKANRVTVAVIFDRFGPYHVARLEAANKYLEVIPIEVAGRTSEYLWDSVESNNLKRRITLFPDKATNQISSKKLLSKLDECLEFNKPDVVAINGWHARSALIALKWCLTNKVPSVVMSDSAARDQKRFWHKEFIKNNIVKKFSAGLVGGKRHAKYLEKLGIKKENIFIGYDVVDNKYFEAQTDNIRFQKELYRKKNNLPQNYILVVSRFIEKKNLPFIIKAYNNYCKKMSNDSWHLCIVGDGQLKNELLKLSQELGLNKLVHYVGFKQYNELPVYFALAKVLIHASTSEQWGLVINEAMASGLPVIVSENCGCVPELVHSGVNGFIIDPTNEQELIDILCHITQNESILQKMALESKKIISSFDVDTFGQALYDASMAALKTDRKHLRVATRVIIQSLLYK
jgi:glycosyltransferase involved in cell wall biosynthesis